MPAPGPQERGSLGVLMSDDSMSNRHQEFSISHRYAVDMGSPTFVHMRLIFETVVFDLYSLWQAVLARPNWPDKPRYE